MLTRQLPARRLADGGSLCRQAGVALLIALIMLVALTLGGIALVRSIDTSNIIAGNLAFQQSATHSSESGTEDAIASFLESRTPADLQSDHLDLGYSASAPPAGDPASWDAYLATMIDPTPVSPPNEKSCAQGVCTLPSDAAGNTVSYSIQRLCQTAGDPLLPATGCASGPKRTAMTGGSLGAGKPPLPMPSEYYYRITIRTVGPRNTVSYVQTIVAR